MTKASDGESRVLALHLRQQLFDPVGLLDCGEAIFDILGAELGLGLAHGFIVRDFALHPIEGRGL